MSGQLRKILIFSLMMMLHFSMIDGEIDCLGNPFICTTDNTYLTCWYDELRNTTVTLTDRSELCSLGSCNMSNDVPCVSDCGGKTFLCPTANTFMVCEIQPDGTSQTTTSEIKYCPVGTYCDGNLGVSECDASIIPDPIPTTADPSTTTTEVPVTDSSTPQGVTDSSTPEEVTDSSTPVEVTDSSTPEEVTDSSTPETTTTTTAEPVLGELVGYTCPSSGLFPHPTNCRRYIYCYVIGNAYNNRQLQCVNDLVYHPELGGCTTDTTPCDNLVFECVATGRFADPVNPSKYIWCLKINGVYRKLTYSCPAGKVYDGRSACIEPSVINAIEAFALSADDTLNLYSTSRRSLSFQSSDEIDVERYEESDEMVADRIYLNSNEDASVYNDRGEKYNYRL